MYDNKTFKDTRFKQKFMGHLHLLLNQSCHHIYLTQVLVGLDVKKKQGPRRVTTTIKNNIAHLGNI